MVVESSPAFPPPPPSPPLSLLPVSLFHPTREKHSTVRSSRGFFLPSFLFFFSFFLTLLLLLPNPVFAAKLFPSGGKTLENGELERTSLEREREREGEKERNRREAAGERLSNSWKTAFMVNCWSNVRVLSWGCREGSGKQIFERRYDVTGTRRNLVFQDFQNF